MKSDNFNKFLVKLVSRLLILYTLIKKLIIVEKKFYKIVKVKLVEEFISDDEDEFVSFFIFNDKFESIIDDNEEIF